MSICKESGESLGSVSQDSFSLLQLPWRPLGGETVNCSLMGPLNTKSPPSRFLPSDERSFLFLQGICLLSVVSSFVIPS